MPLKSPDLDDRDFNQLMEEARRRIERTASEWTDFSPANPGMTLLELFAHLTETMIYRLNRLPEKAYVEFLRLIGVNLHPPAAASVTLTFSRSNDDRRRIEIPRGTRVAAERDDNRDGPPVFATTRRAVIAPDDQSVDVLAYHGVRVEGELVGVGTGLPGLSVEVQHSPVVGSTGEDSGLVIGVEAKDEIDEQAPTIQYAGKIFRIWQEVDNFTDIGANRAVYIADRFSGTITFAPAARTRQEDDTLEDRSQPLAAVPPAGQEIRAWYRYGGGPAGNVRAHTLTVLKDAISGIEVTNETPASGGRAEESLENALERGPQELHSLNRAVTARDFELVARYNSQAIDRTKAVTQAALWRHGLRGTVNVLLVPRPREEDRGTAAVTPGLLRDLESETVRNHVQDTIDQRRPLGTNCLVNWTRYKTIHVKARIVVHREENPQDIEQRVLRRLYQTISPVPTDTSPSGWPFGQAVRVSHIYEIALAEPGVLWVDQVRLQMEGAPETDIVAIATDSFQPNTWYAGRGATLYRSLNDGQGWEPAGQFPGEEIVKIEAHPDIPGILAVVTRQRDESKWFVHTSRDCGETWGSTVQAVAFEVEDIAWTEREGTPLLLLATEEGLYELVLQPEASPVPVLVDRQRQDLGFYAVAVSKNLRGEITAAVAAQETRGVYLSNEGGRANSFRHTGLDGEDIRTLEVQFDGPRSYLWAAAAAAGADDPGKGCFRWELLGAEDPPGGWQSFSEGWEGGSCLSIAFLAGIVLGASYRSGILQMDTTKSSPSWETPDVQCGLPLRDPGRFQPVETVAARENTGLVMAGGSEGIFSSEDEGKTYRSISGQQFTDKVTLPPTWLFCSGDHEITVVTEDEAE
jgi:hypothetical protein